MTRPLPNEARLRDALADARVSVRDFDAILAAAQELMAQTWGEGWEAFERYCAGDYGGPDDPPNPYERYSR